MVAKKNEVSNATGKQAELIVNNAFIDSLSRQLDIKRQYGLTFPADYNPTNELMGAYLILKETSDKEGRCVLETCSQASIANSLMSMVRSGLSMTKGQCYPVAFNGKLNIMPSVYGNTVNARRYGLVDINASCIYKNDTFKMHKEDGKTIIDEHCTSFENMDDSCIIGAYAVAIMSDGSKRAEVMNMKMIETSWKQGYSYKDKGYGTHQKFRDQMCEKTVKNRLLKYIIKTFGESNVASEIDSIESKMGVNPIDENVKHDVEEKQATETFVEAEVVEGEVIAEEKSMKEQVDEAVQEDLPAFAK